MITDLDFVLSLTLPGSTATINPAAPDSLLSADFTTTIVEMRSSGLFLATLGFNVVDMLSPTSGIAEFDRWKTKSTVKLVVKASDGSPISNRVYPEQCVFECASEHTHTFATGTVSGINGFTTSFATGFDSLLAAAISNHGLRSYHFLELRKSDRLVIIRDPIPDVHVYLSLVRLSNYWTYTGKAEI